MPKNTPPTPQEQEHREYLLGWSLYQDCGLPLGACTNDAQRKGHRQAQAGERDVAYAENRAAERKQR